MHNNFNITIVATASLSAILIWENFEPVKVAVEDMMPLTVAREFLLSCSQ